MSEDHNAPDDQSQAPNLYSLDAHREALAALKAAEERLKRMSDDVHPVTRATALLDVAEPLLALGRNEEAWRFAREGFSVFVDYEDWQRAVEAADVLYQTGQEGAIAALGQGIWLAVTYPVKAQSTVTLLNHVLDETPDDSDGAAVAAMVAHYIAGLRTEGEERDSLTFLTTQMISRVAKRHRGIEDQETLNVWLEMYDLNDVPKLLNRLGTIIDVMVGERWWFDRDALRAKLPVN
jgi:hypothetical protein